MSPLGAALLLTTVDLGTSMVGAVGGGRVGGSVSGGGRDWESAAAVLGTSLSCAQYHICSLRVKRVFLLFLPWSTLL